MKSWVYKRSKSDVLRCKSYSYVVNDRVMHVKVCYKLSINDEFMMMLKNDPYTWKVEFIAMLIIELWCQ